MSLQTRFSDPGFDLLRAGQRTLAAGARDVLVLSVQTALADMGFALPGGPDGAFGAQTKKAVTNFQRHAATLWADLPATGEVDAATMRALDQLAALDGSRGQRWNVPSPQFEGRQIRVAVVKSEHRTFLYDAAGALLGIFPNAVGAKLSPTDEGLKVVWTKINEKGAQELGRSRYNQPLVFGPRILDLRWADGRSSDEELHGTSALHAYAVRNPHGSSRCGDLGRSRSCDLPNPPR